MNFNVKPGMSLWRDMSDKYKEEYRAKYGNEGPVTEHKVNHPYVPKPRKHEPPLISPSQGGHMGSYEILVTGSSRPQLWPYFWDSVKKMCIMRQPHRVTVHEDFVFPKQSEKVMKYAQKLQEKGEVDVINSDKPAIGLAETLNRYIVKHRLEADYVFYLQEDWEFERPIDIDQIIYVMDRNPHINLVFFNKIKN